MCKVSCCDRGRGVAGVVAVRVRFGEAPGRAQALATRPFGSMTGPLRVSRSHRHFVNSGWAPGAGLIATPVMALSKTMRVLACLALTAAFAPPAPVAVRQQTKQLMKKPSPVASGVR